MAVNIIRKSPNNSVIVHFTGTGQINCTGNDSVSDLASSGETVTSATIKQVFFGSPSGNSAYWTVTRGDGGANSVVGVFDSTAWMDFAGSGASLSLESAGEFIYCTATACDDASSYLMMEIKKEIG